MPNFHKQPEDKQSIFVYPSFMFETKKKKTYS